MPEQILIETCSPTLAGMKPSNLISLPYATIEQARSDIREMNRIFVQKGMRAVPMNYRKGRVLLYLYRPALLRKTLQSGAVRRFLEPYGYDCRNTEHCVAMLGRRIRARRCSEEFPHEIGVFLGYPLEDVQGFIDHRDRACKCVGSWKVYGDAEQAEQIFRRYRRCTETYRQAFLQGWSLERLTVRSA